MIVTLTPNTTIDQTVFVASLTHNKTLRATHSVYSMGGKPTDASYILGELGISSQALGFAAGALGEKVRQMLSAKGVTVDFAAVNGESRMNVVIIAEDEGSQTTITTSTLDVTPAHIDALRARFIAALEKGASVVVMGGTLPVAVPPAFYTEFIALAKARGVTVIFDAADANLRAGLESAPHFIKPNRDELSALMGAPVSTLDEAYQAGRQLVTRYGTQPIITLGKDGALAVLHDRAYYVPPLEIEVVSAAGAGDAMLAGLAAALGRGQTIEEGLRLGTAAAAAVCLMPGTAECRREDVERLLPLVCLEDYPPTE